MDYSALSLFAGLSYADSQALHAYLREVHFQPGQQVFAEGVAGEFLAIVSAGKVAVYKGGNQIAIVGLGRVFGEVAVLDGRPRSATCVAEEGATVLLLDRSAMQRMEKELPALAAKVYRAIAYTMAGRLRRAEDKLADLLWAD